MRLERAVYCSPGMSLFGKRLADILEVPLFVGCFCGDVEIVHIVGMYDPPTYQMTLEHTGRAKNRIIHWCGTDVQLLRNAGMLPEAVHICDSENLRRELAAAGVEATTITWPTEIHPELTPFPEENMLAFYTGNNPDKYGASIVSALQDCLPNWTFFVYGIGSYNNAQMLEAIKHSRAYIRLTDHDGGMVSPREFLEAGRYAITTSELPFADVVKKEDIPGILKVIRRIEKSVPNELAHQYYKKFNSAERFLDEMKAGGFLA